MIFCRGKKYIKISLMMTVLIEALRAEDMKIWSDIIFHCHTYSSIEKQDNGKQDKNDLINKDISYCLNHFT